MKECPSLTIIIVTHQTNNLFEISIFVSLGIITIRESRNKYYIYIIIEAGIVQTQFSLKNKNILNIRTTVAKSSTVLKMFFFNWLSFNWFVIKFA